MGVKWRQQELKPAKTDWNLPPSLTAPQSPILMLGWDLQERSVPFLWSGNVSSPGVSEGVGVGPAGTGVAAGPPAVPPQQGKPAEQ